MKKFPWLMPALIFVSCLAVAAVWLSRIEPLPRGDAAPGAVQKIDRRDFALTDTEGRKVSLDTYRGKWLLLFFGFTNCPDACPTALLNVGATLREMGAEAAQIQPIFITLDPERDTPALLKDYLLNFGDNIVGLSGAPDDIAAAAKSYAVFYRKRPLEGGDYTLEHSTGLYLIAPDGTYRRVFAPDADPAVFAKQLAAAMAAQP